MSERLLLDEHYPPMLAQLLRQAGFDVVGVAEDPAMLGAPDPEVFRVAAAQGRRVVTENVRDFRPLLTRALSDATPYAPLLFTTAKRHPRRIDALGALASSLRAWLEEPDPPKQAEEWL